MTSLAHTCGDDFPLAAKKHEQDARTLLGAARYDGAAYLAGYTVECAAKAIILHDRAFDAATRTIDAATLQAWHETLRKKPYGHALLQLVSEYLGPQGQAYAHFLPSTGDEIVADWKETLRYREEHVSDVKALAFVTSATNAAAAIIQMQLDGVL